MHTLVFIGWCIADVFTGGCALALLVMLLVCVFSKQDRKTLVWEVPVTVAVLAAFWGAVAFGLSRLL